MAETRTPAEIAEKQARNLKASTPEIQRGVERVTEAPGVRAAAKKDKMRERLLEAIDNGKWEENVAAVPLSEWKQKTVSKGIPRIAAGIDGAIDKLVDFHGQRQDHQSQIDRELENMPDVSLEDGINKAVHQMRRMSEFRFRR